MELPNTNTWEVIVIPIVESSLILLAVISYRLDMFRNTAVQRFSPCFVHWRQSKISLDFFRLLLYCISHNRYYVGAYDKGMFIRPKLTTTQVTTPRRADQLTTWSESDSPDGAASGRPL